MSQCRSFGSNYHPSSQSRKVSIGIVVDQFAKKPSDIREYGAVPFTGNLGSSKENTNEETRKNGKGKDAGKEKESEAAVHEASLLVATPTGVFDPKQGQRYNVPNNSPKNTRKFNSSQMSVLKSDDGQQKKFGSVTYGKKGQRDGSSNRVEEVSFAIGQKLKDPVEEVVLEKPVYTEKQGHEALRMKIWEALAAVSTPTKELSNSQTKNNCTDNLEPEQKSDEKKSSAVKPRQNSDTIESDSDGPSHTMKRPVTRSLTRKRPTKVQQHKTTNAPSSSDRHKQIEKTTFFFNEGLSRRTTSATIGGSSGSRGRKKNCSTIEPRKLHFPKSSNASETFHVTDTGYMEDHIDSSSGFKKGTGRHSYQFPFIEKTDKPGGNFESIFPKSVDEQVDGIGPSLRNNGEPHFDFNSPTHRVNTPTETCFGGLSPNNKQGDQEDVYSPMKGIINMENIRSFKSFYASDPNSKKSNEAKEISEDEVEQEDFSSEPQFNFKPPTLGLQPPAESCFGGSSLKTNQGKQEDVNRPTKVVYNMKNIRRFSNFFASKSDSNKENKKTEVSDDEVEQEESPVEKSLPSQKVMNTANILSTPSSEEDGSESSDEGPSEAETPEIATAQQPEILFHPTKRCRLNDGADATVYSPPSSPKVSENFYELPSEMNEEDGLARAVSLFAMVLKRVKSKMKSVANRRSAEILTSVATEMHLQLQNAESQIQTDLWKLSGIGKTKRRRLEIRFQEQQEQLKGIYERFRNEVNMHLQDCRSTFEELESQQTEFRDIVEKQKASHGKLMLEAEQAIKTQLDGAERRITTVHKSARQKMLQLRYVIAECLKEDVLY
ncbi:meiosis-specific protein ASY3 isoform X3 [Daucus carota subsp. sativus]|uniref:meiosis-specific protein ASY3 isoform X3 n=1 Tax=Daucus carota subsp. sativus TaxID=79200 RepID=UPI003082E606